MADQTLQERLDAATDQIETDAGLFHDVVHGPASGAGSTVETEGGDLDTVAKRLDALDAEYAGTNVIVQAVAAKDAAEAAQAAAEAAQTAALHRRTVFVYEAEAEQTLIAGEDLNERDLSYVVGLVDVLVDGVELVDGVDFTADDGETIDIAEPLREGALVVVKAMESMLISDALVAGQNLADLLDKPAAFATIKQAATISATGVVELATDAETVTGTDAARAVTPAGLTARLAAPGAIGGTTPAAITGTTITATGGVVISGGAFGAGGISQDGNWGMYFRSSGAETIAAFAFADADNNRIMVGASDGDIGIGTDTPASRLTVVTPSDGGLYLTDNDVVAIYYASSADAAVIGTLSDDPFHIYTNNVKRVGIAANGQVEINSATTPLVLNATASTGTKVALFDNGSIRGLWGATTGHSLFAYGQDGSPNGGFGSVSNAANWVEMIATAAGDSPQVRFNGTGEAVTGVFRNKGAAGFHFYGDGFGTPDPLLIINSKLNAVNYAFITAGTEGQPVEYGVGGPDADIDHWSSAKGAGVWRGPTNEIAASVPGNFSATHYKVEKAYDGTTLYSPLSPDPW